MDKTGVSMVGHGTFLIKSADIDSKESYTIKFGDDNTMPSCSCPSWKEFFYPCKHFFCVFEKYPLWGWEALSSLYRNLPFLILDFEDKTMYEMNKEEDPVMEEDPVIINNEKEEVEELHHNPEDILFQQVSPRDCRELLGRMKNLTYDVEEKSPVFNEVQTLLLSALALLEGNTKKENGITVAPVKKNEKPLTFQRKRKYLELSKKKKKSATRYGYARDKKENYSKIKIENKTNKKPKRLENSQLIRKT